MNEISIDTNKVRSCGEDIIKLVEELKMNYNGLFLRLEKMPNQTREWVGSSAEAYVASVIKEKAEYMKFANDLYKYGNYLINAANEYDRLINGIRR